MNIKCRSVYLSDLKKIVDIYVQQEGLKINALTQDFGLPQHVMMGDNEEILACSFVLFNESDEIIYRVLSDKAIVSADMAENLLNFTKKEEKSYQIKENLKKSICRLTNFINHSA